MSLHLQKKMSLALITGLVVFILVLIPGGLSAATLFSDNFDDGNTTGWTVQSGTWSVVQDSGSYVYYQSSLNEGRTSAGSQFWTNVSVEARVKVDNFNGSNRAYVCGRYKDGNNYYAASLMSNTIEIRKKLSGSSSTLISKSYTVATGTWYTVKLVVNGSSLSMYINGTQQLTATDSSITSGAVGLIAYKVVAKYDDVIVSDLTGGSTPTPTSRQTLTPTPTTRVTPTVTRQNNPTPTTGTNTPTPTSALNPTPTRQIPTPTPTRGTVTATPTPTNPPSGSNSIYNLTGFASSTIGGGDIPETDPRYARVSTPQQFLDALYSNYKNQAYGAYTQPVKVIEILNDLNLGYKEVGTSVTSSTSGSSLLIAHATPKLNPVLMQTGVSKVDIKPSAGGLTIFSANGATIKHCTFNIKSTHDIIIRNLKFDEMWEWDEASKGNYDSNDWDFIDLGNGGTTYNVWIDHCTFTKAYDGILDMKAGTYNVTISWCRVLGDDGATNSNSWVRQQFNYLEQNSASYPMYNWLRTHGFSINDLVTINQGHDKTHLAGSNSLDSANSSFKVTFHHDWYTNVWDRNPVRLRAGNVHVYNFYADDTVGLAALRLRDTRVAAMATADQVKLDGNSTTDPTYHMGVFLNGTISTENGAVLVEKSIYWDCLYPLRNNQTDPSDPTYTGKIKAMDTIYHMDNADGTVTEIRGNSEDSGNPMGPFQAPRIVFSWNGFSSLPYSYAMDDPSQLKTLLGNGAGAGRLSWAKSNWLKTSY